MAKHQITHWEIMGPDGTALAGFYSQLFGWTTEEYPGFDQYYGVQAEDTGVGGAVGKGGEQMPSYTAMYVEVDNVDATMAQVEAGGGTVVMPRTVIPGVVAFGMFRDPAGNLMGLAESEAPPAE